MGIAVVLGGLLGASALAEATVPRTSSSTPEAPAVVRMLRNLARSDDQVPNSLEPGASYQAEHAPAPGRSRPVVQTDRQHPRSEFGGTPLAPDAPAGLSGVGRKRRGAAGRRGPVGIWLRA